jgi:hypothetical protein
MDLAGGTLDYEGYEILRTFQKEAEADGKKRYHGLLPSSSPEELQNWRPRRLKMLSVQSCVVVYNTISQADHGESVFIFKT